jgi:hypothetical protein
MDSFQNNSHCPLFHRRKHVDLAEIFVCRFVYKLHLLREPVTTDGGGGGGGVGGGGDRMGFKVRQ